MSYSIHKAAVIGSGIMGSSIAAHLANVGIRCLLLDIVPQSLTERESASGLTLQSPQVRNRLAADAIAKLKKAKPSPLYTEAFAERIVPGNLEDDLERLRDADWIIEAVVENLPIKTQLMKRIETVWKPGTIVSTNTSGISVNAMTAECGADFRKHFLGTHFFNPPRYMPLLEIIPGADTDPAIARFMGDFGESRLGKSVVTAKDTPNFIANRIGTYGLMVTLREMLEKGYSVDEVDAVTGPAMGRPKSATFRTLDLVGLDTFASVAGNVFHHVTDEREKAEFQAPEPLLEMIKRGWLGEKSGQGFYKKIKTAEGSSILSLDLSTMEYVPRKKVGGASLEAAKLAKGAAAKTKALLSGGDRYAGLAWDILKHVLVYAADKLGEIADTIADIDMAMRAGFNWQQGPFETWDAIGLKSSVERMEQEGLTVPAWVQAWIAAGNDSFYRTESGKRFYVANQMYRELEQKPQFISLATLKQQNKTVKANSGASLIDIGDGVACLEFHSQNNAIGADILIMVAQSMEEVRRNFRGMVIANEGKNFCVGANIMQLLMEAQDEEWDEIDGIIRLFQNTFLKLRHFEKPVVAAPHHMTLGGGVEACMAADRVCASAETYYGLVETGVGLIPGGGGCKEMARRLSSAHPDREIDLQPMMNKIFMTIGTAKVSSSADDAKKLGLMQERDRVVVSRERLIYEAKQTVLELDGRGYVPKMPEKIRVLGEDGRAVLQMGAYAMKQSGLISDHDLLIAGKLAHVLCGGNVPAGTEVSEAYMLDLEREAFLSLCGEAKTQQRMQHMLAVGKPLRN